MQQTAKARKRGDERALARWRRRHAKARDIAHRAARVCDVMDELRDDRAQLGGATVRDRVLSVFALVAALAAPALHVAGDELAMLVGCKERQLWYVVEQLRNAGFIRRIHTWEERPWTTSTGLRYSRRQRRNTYVLTRAGRDLLGLPTVARTLAEAVDNHVENAVREAGVQSNAVPDQGFVRPLDGHLSLSLSAGAVDNGSTGAVGPPKRAAHPESPAATSRERQEQEQLGKLGVRAAAYRVAGFGDVAARLIAEYLDNEEVN